MTTDQTTMTAEAISEVVHRICDAPDHIELGAAFYDALALPPIELRRAMRALARLEGGSTPDLLHERALTRLRALFRLDREQARVIARAFDDAFLDLPEGWRERNREAELGAILNGLDGRSFRFLAGVVPSLHDRFDGEWLLDHLDQPQPEPSDMQLGPSPEPVEPALVA